MRGRPARWTRDVWRILPEAANETLEAMGVEDLSALQPIEQDTMTLSKPGSLVSFPLVERPLQSESGEDGSRDQN